MNLIDFCIDFLYPRKYVYCDEKINERYTCRKCSNIIEYYHEKVNIYANNELGCDKIISVIPYNGFMKESIWKYKFRGIKYFAPAFAEILTLKLEKYNIGFDIIVAVPISSKRLKERGYNQSELIAKYLSKFTKINYESDVLIKIKNNLRQSELDLNERKENVKDAYSIKNIDIIKNKKVILIDDIYTTGATINECAKVLKLAGAQEVVGLTVMYSALDDNFNM